MDDAESIIARALRAATDDGANKTEEYAEAIAEALRAEGLLAEGWTFKVYNGLGGFLYNAPTLEEARREVARDRSDSALVPARTILGIRTATGAWTEFPLEATER